MALYWFISLLNALYTQIQRQPLIHIWFATVGRMNIAVGLIKLKSNKAFCKCANPHGGVICNFHNDATVAKAFTKRTQLNSMCEDFFSYQKTQTQNTTRTYTGGQTFGDLIMFFFFFKEVTKAAFLHLCHMIHHKSF